MPKTLDKFWQNTDIIFSLIDQVCDVVDLISQVLMQSPQRREQWPSVPAEMSTLPWVLTKLGKARMETVPVMVKESAAVRAEINALE